MKRLVSFAAVVASLGYILAAGQAPPATAPQAAPAARPAAPAQLSEGISEDMRVQPDAIDKLLADGSVFLLDVREPKELEEFGSYEGYVNIPMSQLESRLGELPKDRPILTA